MFHHLGTEVLEGDAGLGLGTVVEDTGVVWTVSVAKAVGVTQITEGAE